MLTQRFGLLPANVCEVVAVLAFLSSAAAIVYDRYLLHLLRIRWRLIAVAVLLSISFRIPWHGAFFHGMEYEDSYVYGVSGREAAAPGYLNSDVGSPYLVTTCAVGNLRSCLLWNTYSGHYIGFPVVLRVARLLVGYSPALSNWISLLADCVATVAVFLICHLLTGRTLVAFFGSLFLASTPAFAVFGTSSSAEPLSSGCIALVLLIFLRIAYDGRENARIQFFQSVAYTAMLLLAVLIKRENVVLALALPVTTCFVARRNSIIPESRLAKIRWALLGNVIVVVFCFTELQYGRTVARETIEFGGFPFALSNVKVLAPAFIRSMFALKWYSCSLLLAATGFALALRRRNLLLIPAVTVVGYLALYTLHVRSAYQVYGAVLTPFDTLRYAMNLMALFAILAASGAAKIIDLSAGVLKASFIRTAGIFVLVVDIGLCYFGTMRVRNEIRSEEWNTRIAPALVASQYSREFGSSDTFIITLEPLIIQMFAPDDINVVSLASVNEDLLSHLQASHPHLTMLYLKQTVYSNAEDEKRYSRQLQSLDRMTQDDLYSNDQFSLIRVVSSGATRHLPSRAEGVGKPTEYGRFVEKSDYFDPQRSLPNFMNRATLFTLPEVRHGRPRSKDESILCKNLKEAGYPSWRSCRAFDRLPIDCRTAHAACYSSGGLLAEPLLVVAQTAGEAATEADECRL